jgi:transcription elongation factor GreA
MSSTPMTPKGLEKLHVQLRHLREVERSQNVRDIEEALAHGDLRENAEYHAAKDRQGHIDGQMKWLESLISSAQVIDPKTLGGERVIFGATVELVDIDDEDADPVRYKLVGEHESDIATGLISYASPIARALIGKLLGDEVVVQTPRGRRTFVIESLEFV